MFLTSDSTRMCGNHCDNVMIRCVTMHVRDSHLICVDALLAHRTRLDPLSNATQTPGVCVCLDLFYQRDEHADSNVPALTSAAHEKKISPVSNTLSSVNIDTIKQNLTDLVNEISLSSQSLSRDGSSVAEIFNVDAHAKTTHDAERVVPRSYSSDDTMHSRVQERSTSQSTSSASGHSDVVKRISASSVVVMEDEIDNHQPDPTTPRQRRKALLRPQRTLSETTHCNDILQRKSRV